MYTRRMYSPRQMLAWTRFELALFLALSALVVVLNHVLGFKWAHLPWLPIALVGTAVAFILGFQNSAAYDRAWEARKIWGGIVNSSRAFGTMVNDFISDQYAATPVAPEALAAERRELVGRHIAWMTALRHALRQRKPWEEFDAHRTNREWTERIGVHEHAVPLEQDLENLMPIENCDEVRAKTNLATQIMGLQSRHIARLHREGLMNDYQQVAFQGVIGDLIAEQGKSERIKNFPYPRQYATLNRLFMWIFVLLVPFGTIDAFIDFGAEIDAFHPEVAPNLVWLNVPFAALVMWIFHTTERIGRVTENPFEGGANDVPITTISRGIEIDLLEMIGEDPANIPPPVEPHDDVQS